MKTVEELSNWSHVYSYLKAHDGQVSLTELEQIANCDLHELVEGLIEYTLMVATNPEYNHYTNTDKQRG